MHLIRMGMAKEEPLIQQSIPGTDVVVLKANLVAHMKDGLSAFLFNWNPHNPGYVIDPFLYAFQQDPDQFYSATVGASGNPKLKRSVQKLLDAYGLPVSEAINNYRPVYPSDFRDNVDEFVKRVSEFQLSTLQAKGTDLESFFTYFQMDQSAAPRILIAASFSLNHSSASEWLPINCTMAEKTGIFYPQHDVYAQIIIDQDVLWDEDLAEKIIKSYNALPIEGVIIWVSGMSEHDAPVRLLKQYLSFLERLRHNKIIWFGSYFSVMLSRYFQETYGVVGVVHGPGYGEDREVDPAGGGFPVAKFYFPALHRRLNYGVALMAARRDLSEPKDYLTNVCHCQLCEQLVNKYGPAEAFAHYGRTQTIFYQRQGVEVSADVPIANAANACALHFLHVKEWEYHGAAEWPDVRDKMGEAAARYHERIPEQEIQHLHNWLAVLSQK